MPRGKRRLKLDVLGIELQILPAMRSRPLQQAGVLMRDHVAPVAREPKWPLWRVTEKQHGRYGSRAMLVLRVRLALRGESRDAS